MPPRVVIWRSPRTGRRDRKHAGVGSGLHRHCHGQPYAETLVAYARARYPGVSRTPANHQRVTGTHWRITAGTAPVGDLERILARLALRTARPRDLARMRYAFQQLPELRRQLADVDSAPVQALRGNMGEFTELRELLERAIIDAPPVLVRDGGVIAPGYNAELDEWRGLADGATDYLDRLEIRERERLGLDTLKVGYNAVHGYYIQISRGQSHGPPSTMYAARR